MGNRKKNKKIFGLVGKDISYSFSKEYFSEKFGLLNLENHEYLNFDINSIEDFLDTVDKHKAFLFGMNVTIPYKEEIFLYVDKVNKKAIEIGAINTIKITNKGKFKGYNTDEYGFRKSLKPLLKKQHKKALILGTGGASKAVAYALKKLGVVYKFVSRNPKNDELSYDNLTEKTLKEYTVLINCTPLGTYPNINSCPDIPYQFLSKEHLLYDLVYNPKQTLFLKKGKKQKTTIKNGKEMLHLQAEKSWEIWNK